MAEKIALTLSEQIDRAKDGRSQKWIIEKMNDAGCELNDVKFSRKKLASNPEDGFNEKELSILSNVLNTTFTIE